MMRRCENIFPFFYILATQFLSVEPQKPRQHMRSLYGPKFRHFSSDPENLNRGAGYYRVFRGRYFKWDEKLARRWWPPT